MKKLGNMYVGIGAYHAGTVVQLDNGEYVARTNKTTEIWYEDDEPGIRWGSRVVGVGGLMETDRHSEPAWDIDDLISTEDFVRGLDTKNEIAQLIGGMNDSDEGGYEIAVLKETVDFHLPKVRVEAWLVSEAYAEDKSLYLDFDAMQPILLWESSDIVNGQIVHPEHALIRLFEHPEIEGWIYPSRDQ